MSLLFRKAGTAPLSNTSAFSNWRALLTSSTEGAAGRGEPLSREFSTRWRFWCRASWPARASASGAVRFPILTCERTCSWDVQGRRGCASKVFVAELEILAGDPRTALSLFLLVPVEG